MAGGWGTETEFELTTLERLRALGYTHAIGAEIAEKHRESDSEVVFRKILREHLTKRYSHLPAESIDEVVRLFARPDGVDTLRRNMAFHARLRTGVEVRVERPDGTHKIEHVYAIDWDHPEDNVFLAVNQLPISGANNRRPDIIIYVNGLPLVLFELKNPYSIAPSEEEALNQIQHYTVDIPQVFDFNALCIVSDGVSTRHGVWTATPEWYAPWKSIDGEHIEPGTTGSMRALVEGLFPKERLLSYIRDFIAFEVANEKITKKGAKYHQFFAVRKAALKAVETHLAGADRRLGVIWHTTGSGKSLSMAFLVGLLRRRPELENPSFVIQVDRTDLDDQLFDQFVAVRSLVGEVKHADSVEQLRDLLATSGGEVIFTTIEKFRLRTDRGEIAHPVLSERSNTVVAEMLRMKQEMDATDARARELGLAEEEVAFYDAVAENAEGVYDEPFLRDLVHDVVQTIKRNLKVDWTEPHRDQVRAEIRAAVKRVLRKRGVRETDFEPFIARFIQQAEAQYAEWPLVA